LVSIRPSGHPKRAGAPDPIIDVKFDQAVGGFKSIDEPQGFAVLDSEGKPLSAIYRTTFHGQTIRLHLASQDRASATVAALSYGHGLAPRCNITDSRDFSLPVFGPILLRKSMALLPFVAK